MKGEEARCARVFGCAARGQSFTWVGGKEPADGLNFEGVIRRGRLRWEGERLTAKSYTCMPLSKLLTTSLNSRREPRAKASGLVS